MKAINWENIREKYKGPWVALDDEETVIASSRSIKEVLERAEEGDIEPSRMLWATILPVRQAMR